MADKPRAMNRLMVAEPYDMDTMIGTNNSGVLMFSPYLEDTDTVSAVISGEGGSDAPVFNAQDSVLWQNLRDAFRDQITAMYRNLRAGNKWNAKYITSFFEEMQSKWPEAMFNEDGRTKYLIPLIDPVTVDEDTGELIRTDRYLTMLQGSKAEQRKWWLYNRFRYMDSKYNTGDASKTINLRLFNGGTLTLTPAIDLYVGVSFGGGTTPALKRTTAETPQTFEYVAPSGVTEMETWIYSADLITDVGDLSVFYPNELDFSRAARLRRLKVGSDATGYANNNLTTINVSNNPLLEYIDCRNCPRLAESIEIEKSTRLKEAYFEGSSITGIELADGCTIEHLHLPASITALTLMNLDKLTDLQIADVSNVTRLMLSNMSTDIIDPIEVLDQMPANSQVYIDGLNLELADAAAIYEALDLFDTMKGVTRVRSANGSWSYHEEEKAQISGKIHTASLAGADIAAFKKRYPYISVTADHVEAIINFKSHDGSVTYETKTIINGADATYTGSTTPTKESTPQYNFIFADAWSLTPNGNSETNALKAVWDNRDVYACFNAYIRSYNVRYMNEGRQVGSTQVVQYGGNATPPADPMHPTDASRYVFQRWEPTGENITGDTDCIAKYKDTMLKTLQYINRKLTDIADLEGYAITKIRERAFVQQASLHTVKFNNATVVGSYSFSDCKKLKEVRLPSATIVNDHAFERCGDGDSIDISFIDIPNVETIANYAFNGCNIGSIFMEKVKSIGSSAFSRASGAVPRKIFIKTQEIPSLANSNAFNTATTGSLSVIYVPDNLIDEYKSATNWASVASIIHPISEVES